MIKNWPVFFWPKFATCAATHPINNLLFTYFSSSSSSPSSLNTMGKARNRTMQTAQKDTGGKKPRNQKAPGSRPKRGEKTVPSSTTAGKVKNVHRFRPGTGMWFHILMFVCERKVWVLCACGVWGDGGEFCCKTKHIWYWIKICFVLYCLLFICKHWTVLIDNMQITQSKPLIWQRHSYMQLLITVFELKLVAFAWY